MIFVPCLARHEHRGILVNKFRRLSSALGATMIFEGCGARDHVIFLAGVDNRAYKLTVEQPRSGDNHDGATFKPTSHDFRAAATRHENRGP